jgi:hypothetical protein
MKIVAKSGDWREGVGSGEINFWANWSWLSFSFLFHFVSLCLWRGAVGISGMNSGATRMSMSSFLSPASKLLRFFQKSRDKWKAKCRQSKKEVKSLKIRLAKMKASRDRWKQRAQQSVEAIASAETGEPTIKNPASGPSGPSSRRCRSLSTAGAASSR